MNKAFAEIKTKYINAFHSEDATGAEGEVWPDFVSIYYGIDSSVGKRNTRNRLINKRKRNVYTAILPID